MALAAESIERKMLAALLEYEEVREDYLPRLTSGDFYRREYKKAFQKIIELENQDRVTITSFRMQSGDDIPVRGIVTTDVLLSEVDDIFDDLRDLHARRHLRRTAVKLQNEVQETSNIDDLLPEIEKEIMVAADLMYDSDSMTLLSEYVPSIKEHMKMIRDLDMTGITTGLPDLDRYTKGWQDGEFIVLAGRPGMGKTDLGLQFALAAARNDFKVGFFSIEMPWKKIVKRLGAMISRLDKNKWMHATYTKSDIKLVEEAYAQFNKLPIYIDDQSSALSELLYKSRRMKKGQDLDLIIIDYLNLIDVPHRQGYNRQNMMRSASKQLKNLAKSIDIPLLVLAQLNRSPELRENHRPKLSDLRSTGGLEQDLDVVLFLYRDSYYDEESSDDNSAEILLKKNRDGEIGEIGVTYDRSTGVFKN